MHDHLISTASRTIVAAKGYRTVKSKAPRPIKPTCFVSALKRFTQPDDIPLTHDEGQDLWRACGGDYISFVNGLYPKPQGPTVNKFGFTKDNSRPKQALVMEGPFDRKGILLDSNWPSVQPRHLVVSDWVLVGGGDDVVFAYTNADCL